MFNTPRHADVVAAIGEAREMLKKRYEQRLGVRRVAWILLPEAINTLRTRQHEGHHQGCLCHSWPGLPCQTLWKICRQFNITEIP